MMSVSFDEKINCRKPYLFSFNMKVDGVERIYDKATMLTVCEDKTISVFFRPAVSYDTVNGRKATLTVAGVEDLYRNTLVVPVKHAFAFAKINTKKALVEVHGVIIKNAQLEKALEEHKELFKKEVLSLVEERDHARLEVTRIEKVQSTGALSLDFIVHPSDNSDLTPTSLVAKLSQALDDHADPKTEPNLLVVGTSMLSQVDARSFYSELHPSAQDAAQADTNVLSLFFEGVFMRNIVVVSALILVSVFAVVAVIYKTHSTRAPVLESDREQSKALLMNMVSKFDAQEKAQKV
jgi:hypothetical protein